VNALMPALRTHRIRETTSKMDDNGE